MLDLSLSRGTIREKLIFGIREKNITTPRRGC